MAKLKITIPEEKIRTSLKIKKSLAEALTDYSIFMSELHKVKISSETIVEGLIEKLLRDKDFQKFRSSTLERKGASHVDKTNTTSKKKESATQSNESQTETEKIL